MNYTSSGFELISINKKKNVKNFRKKILSVFSKASQLNGLKKITEDNEINNLYNHNKKIWVAAYDQIRMLPEINDIIDKNLIKIICKKAKIKFPALTSRPVIRVCMPEDRGTSSVKQHIDYPTHRGSSNAVTIWIPLQNTDEKNGALKLSSKSHNKKNYYGSVLKSNVVRKDNIMESNLISVPAKVGQAIIFSHFTVHESGQNLSNKIRFSLDFRLNDLDNKVYAKRKYYLNERIFFKKI